MSDGIQRDDAGGVRVEAVCPYCDGKRSKWNDSRKWNDICVPCAGMGSVHVTLPASTVAAIVASVVRESADADGTLTLTMRCPFHYRTHDLSTDCGWCGGVALVQNSEPEEVEIYPTVADFLAALLPGVDATEKMGCPDCANDPSGCLSHTTWGVDATTEGTNGK